MLIFSGRHVSSTNFLSSFEISALFFSAHLFHNCGSSSVLSNNLIVITSEKPDVWDACVNVPTPVLSRT